MQLAGELGRLHPADIWLPSIRAAVELQRGDPAQAIEQLQAATRYQAGAEFWPQYLRGLAYLKLCRGTEAGAEFREILEYRGHAPLSVLYPLAYLGSASGSGPICVAGVKRDCSDDDLWLAGEGAQGSCSATCMRVHGLKVRQRGLYSRTDRFGEN